MNYSSWVTTMGFRDFGAHLFRKFSKCVADLQDNYEN